MCLFSQLVLALVLSATTSHAARILGVIPTPSYSHQIVFRPLWRELALRGHEITLITTDPMRDASLVNLKEIDVSFSYKTLRNNMSAVVTLSKRNFGESWKRAWRVFGDVYEEQLGHHEVKNLLTDKSQHFDLVIAEYIHVLAYAFATKFDCPFIGIGSLDANSYIYGTVGNPTHPILYPGFAAPYQIKPRFLQRLYNVKYELHLMYMYHLYIPNIVNPIATKHFGIHFSPYDTAKNVSLILVNKSPIFQDVRPTVPAVVYFGGATHLGAPKMLPEDLQSYLDASENGVIYFSLGTNVKSGDLPPETLTAILETFSEVPFEVLWKTEFENVEKLPENVKMVKWVPQQDVLRHPKIKLFITQGGLQSLEEAVFNHVPVIGIPFFADQPANMAKMVAMGAGISLDYETLHKSQFKDAILAVTNNPQYRDTVKEIAELALDQPMTGLEKAVWWTEYVIRHKGARHLRSPALDIPFYQYYLLDIIGFVLAALCLFFYTFYLVIKLGLSYFIKLRKIKRE